MSTINTQTQLQQMYFGEGYDKVIHYSSEFYTYQAGIPIAMISILILENRIKSIIKMQRKSNQIYMTARNLK